MVARDAWNGAYRTQCCPPFMVDNDAALGGSDTMVSMATINQHTLAHIFHVISAIELKAASILPQAMAGWCVDSLEQCCP